MKITFAGAAGEVTGSKHLIEFKGKKILLDCGMFQGRRKEAAVKNAEYPFDPKDVDAVVLSHAHIDHSGNIPMLVKKGFEGPIYSTFATRDLCNYMLRDSAYIQEREAEWLRKKKKKVIDDHLYNLEDAEKALAQFRGIDYEQSFVVTEGVVACFYDAGHILGSAVVHLIFYDKDTGERHSLGFTGDLGRPGLPLLRDPQMLPKCDTLITETTYGDRFHGAVTTIEEELEDIVNGVCKKGGKLIIPAFSLERTQEIVYHLNLLHKDKKIPEIPIYVDSPLSGNVTEVFRGHPECFDKETYREFLDQGDNPFGFGSLKYIRDVADSKALNDKPGPMIIISASGMCEHGRILHHLKNNLQGHENSVLFVGYQGEHTLGRKIRDGESPVNIFGDPYKVKAEIFSIDAFSAHADRSDLLDYIHKIEGVKKIILVHGEEESQGKFKDALEESGRKDVQIPKRNETIEI
ncbi:MBL fold metallo-hydrolase [Candidatus Peregrinibacteria bacterium]|nr:MBL fold metallo-hydrolase [Candidatus Peregrinibacteria bacterium]